MLSTDANKSVNLAMSEDVYAYRGTVQYVNAPFGAYIDFSIIIPPSTVLANYVTKVPLFGTGVINFASQDVGLIPLGAQIKATVTNSDGTGDYDTAADFKVATFIELYRSTLL